MSPAAILLSIPSPSSGQINLGPLRLTAYGLMIAMGVLVAVAIARRRHARHGGDPDDFSQIAVWAVVGGLIGARLYHVVTDLDRFSGNWLDVVKVWEGGLGIPGGLLGGVIAGWWAARRRRIDLGYGLDIAAPAVPVAQAIGRWGNWWNQELFGRPTSLPWALEIDRAHRPAGFVDEPTYHPTFLYESLWNLGLAGLILLVDRRAQGRLRPGSLFALYVAGYGVGRFWVESLRIDPAQLVGGIRINVLVSAVAVVGAVGWLVVFARRQNGDPLGLTPADPPDVSVLEPDSDHGHGHEPEQDEERAVTRPADL